MKIKVTKTLANALNKAIKSCQNNYCINTIEVTTVDARQFMDEFVWECEEYGDMDFDKNGNEVLKLMKVIYKDNCYANPSYFNTFELGKIAKKYSIDNKITFDDFVKGFLNETNI